MFCQKCGNKLTEDALFCSACGTKIITTPENQPEDTTIVSILKEEEKESIKLPETQEEISINPSEITTENAAEPVVETENNIPDDGVMTAADDDIINLNNPEPDNANVQQPNSNIEFITSKKEAKKLIPRTKGAKIAIAVCSVFMSVFIGLMVLSLIVQVFLRFGLTEDKISDALNNVDYTEVKADKIVDVQALSQEYNTEIPEDAKISEVIYSCIDQKELVNPITQEEIDRLLDRVDFESFIAAKAAKAFEIARTGSDEQPVTAKEIVEFIKNNSDVIETTIGIEILDVDYAYMQKYLEEKSSGILSVASPEKNADADVIADLAFYKYVGSNWVLCISCFLVVGFGLLIGYINRRISTGLLYTGIPFAAAGLPLLVIGLLYKPILNQLSEYIPSEFIIQITGPIIGIFNIICAVTVVLGAVMIAAGIVIKVIKKKRFRPIAEITY